MLKKKLKIVVVGMGYVGLSNAVLLSQHNEVIGVDISSERVNLLNRKISPIKDDLLSEYLKNKDLDFKATTNLLSAVQDAAFIIIAVPTNFDETTNFFDTSILDSVLTEVFASEPRAAIVVRSTIPFGFIESRRKILNSDNIFFVPEFLREGSALYDNLYPSRIIVGDKSIKAKEFSRIISEGAIKKNLDLKFTGPSEAEAIKLFANTYLAMRVAFYNELDTFALKRGLNCREIIEGTALDPRIGNGYNNPSFGYGGYCLPKDTKQLLVNFGDTPQNLVTAIVQSNFTRKEAIVDHLMARQPKSIGVYRLIMKTGSDNFRESAVQEIMEILNRRGVEIVIYEPLWPDERFSTYLVEKSFEKFIERSDLILANRVTPELNNFQDKLFSRDLFGCN
jgi:UDPglucose 6-dehydrogenase